ncbi:unnamed protein product [Phytophthora fragariaefolia]|uniref:Unnamed protein product n=1 Tax=Phytophthora fragariaefolia TaxID=1490495 RepID=A0A9W6U604_9STRA|nr:unnamed protein product [Phytophthora fragariaefolia]
MTALKKRKASYLRCKEEQGKLRNQLLALQQQLADLQAKQKGGETQEKQRLDAAVGLNSALKDAMEQQQLGVATAQGWVSRWVRNQDGNPMSDPICLGRERRERREVLLNMKDERLARGFRYVTARCQHLDTLKPHYSEEKFEDESGGFCFVRNEVIPFPGAQSMRKVFDAVKFTMNTLEICISEQLGHITLRDDYDTVNADSFISNYRLVSGLDSGVSTELNAVAFGQLFESFEESSGESYAVLTIDSVDHDDLHPYHPYECVRKMINGTVVLMAVPAKHHYKDRAQRLGRDTKDGSVLEEDTVDIVMLRSFFVKSCRPEFEVSDVTAQELRDNATRWGDVVLQSVRRIIYA